MTARLSALILLVVASACGSDDDDGTPFGSDSFQDDDPPIGCQTGTAGCVGDTDPSPFGDDDGDDPPGSPVGGPCDNTNQCADAAVCGASFEDGEAGPLICREMCIAVGDEAAWCADDTACCSGLCSTRGLCLESESDEGTTSGESGGADSTSGGTGG